MKRATIVLTVILLLSIVSTAAAGTKGNGAPSGPHYNLNIIGVPKGKTADMTGNNGHRIFVPLDRKGEQGPVKIWLFESPEGESFEVLDANGTDRDGASFQLPDPGEATDGHSDYSVWARAVGTPGGSADMTTCAYALDDTDLSDPICSVATLHMERTKGKVGTFGDVSKYLLYIYVCTEYDAEDTDLCLSAVPVNIFDEAYQDYFWNYDNNGLKVLQLRFYPDVEGDVPTTWPFP